MLAPSDRGLAYGDGLFETMAAVDGRIRWLDYHLERLTASCRRLAIPCVSADLLREEIRTACPAEGRFIVKVIVTRGSGARGYRPPDNPEPTRILSVGSWPSYPSEYYTDGIAVCSLDTPVGENPSLAGMKHLCRLEQVLGRMELEKHDAQEGLQFASSGAVVGGTMSNLFAVIEGRLSTPSVEASGVAGVMRRIVMETAGARGLSVVEGVLTAADLQSAQALFMTNAVIGIWPVKRLDAREFDIGQITEGLMAALGIGRHE